MCFRNIYQNIRRHVTDNINLHSRHRKGLRPHRIMKQLQAEYLHWPPCSKFIFSPVNLLKHLNNIQILKPHKPGAATAQSVERLAYGLEDSGVGFRIPIEARDFSLLHNTEFHIQ